MPKITGGAGAATFLLLTGLLLAGCAAPAGGEPTKSEATVETVAPLVAETPDAPATGDAAFLEAVREALPSNTQIPDATDGQLLAAGEEACDQIAAGADTSTLSLIEGEADNGYGAYMDSGAIISAARSALCD